MAKKKSKKSKRDKDLFSQLRKQGVRKSAADQISKAAAAADSGKEKAGEALAKAVADLRKIAGDLEKRIPGRAKADGLAAARRRRRRPPRRAKTAATRKREPPAAPSSGPSDGRAARRREMARKRPGPCDARSARRKSTRSTTAQAQRSGAPRTKAGAASAERRDRRPARDSASATPAKRSSQRRRQEGRRRPGSAAVVTRAPATGAASTRRRRQEPMDSLTCTLGGPRASALVREAGRPAGR